MKVHLAIGEYEFVEFEVDTLEAAKDMQDKARAIFGGGRPTSVQQNMNQGSYGGGQRKLDVPKELQRGSSTNQVKQAGYPCDYCQTPLKLSKKGNIYCGCWFELDPNKQPHNPDAMAQDYPNN